MNLTLSWFRWFVVHLDPLGRLWIERIDVCKQQSTRNQRRRPTTMILRTIPVAIQATKRLPNTGLCINRTLSTSSPRHSDPLPSLLEDVASPLEVTTVLRSGKGFKIRSLQNRTPRTIHGNVLLMDGEYFLWRPKLQSLQSGMLDISPESWGILDVISPKPGMHSTNLFR
jgi:hypothetical protein